MCENSASIVAGETSAKKYHKLLKSSPAHLALCLHLDTQFSQLPKLMLCCIFNGEENEEPTWKSVSVVFVTPQRDDFLL